MSTAIRAVIWDVDGVLIDSEPLHLASLKDVCGRYGYAFDDAANRRWLGTSFVDMWDGIPEFRRFGLSFEELIGEIIDHYIAGVHGGMARTPAPDIVSALARRGVPQASASSSPRRIVEANIAAVGVGDHLTARLAREDVADGKPAPDLYLAAAGALGLEPAHCLAVEDTSTGVAAAKAAGLRVIAWPHAMTETMDFSQADWRLDDLAAFDWENLSGI